MIGVERTVAEILIIISRNIKPIVTDEHLNTRWVTSRHRRLSGTFLRLIQLSLENWNPAREYQGESANYFAETRAQP